MLKRKNAIQQQPTKEIQIETGSSAINAASKSKKSREQVYQKHEMARERGLKNRLSNAIEVLLSTEKEEQATTPEWLKKNRKKKPHRTHL